MCSGKITSSFDPKARKKVVRPTPAASAMSPTVVASYPRSSKRAKAAARIRSRTSPAPGLLVGLLVNLFEAGHRTSQDW